MKLTFKAWSIDRFTTDKPNMPNKIETLPVKPKRLKIYWSDGTGIKLCKVVVSSVLVSMHEFILITYLEIRSPIFQPAETTALAAERMALKIAVPPPADRASARIVNLISNLSKVDLLVKRVIMTFI